MSTILQVQTATPDRSTGLALARSAVAARLAASAHLTGPIASVFWHEGTLGEADEWHLLLKTTADRYPALESHLRENHPWSNPEITAVALTQSSAAYRIWLEASVTDQR